MVNARFGVWKIAGARSQLGNRDGDKCLLEGTQINKGTTPKTVEYVPIHPYPHLTTFALETLPSISPTLVFAITPGS
jgi:hypothetical protein